MFFDCLIVIMLAAFFTMKFNCDSHMLDVSFAPVFPLAANANFTAVTYVSAVTSVSAQSTSIHPVSVDVSFSVT
jgi:hypothetical protein